MVSPNKGGATPVHNTLKSWISFFGRGGRHYFVEEKTAVGDDDETFMTNNKVHAGLPFTPLFSSTPPPLYRDGRYVEA